MIRSLKFYRKIYTEFVRMDIKRIMMYPIDFVLGNMGFFLETISTLFVLFIIVMNTGFLGEFSGYQVLFFYSYLMLVNALWEIFFVTVLEIPYMIQSGELDIFLVRPLNILFQFWTGIFFIKLLFFILSSIFVRYAIYLFLSTTAFWWVSNDGIKSIFWEVSQLGNYPISIYPQWLKAVLMIIPFSFIGYFPVHELLLSTNQFTLETLINFSSGWIIFYLVYQFFWKQGLKKYQSIGG